MTRTIPLLAAAAALSLAAAAAPALTDAEMQSPEAQAVGAMLAQQGIPDDALRALSMEQVRYIGTLLASGDAARRAQAMTMLGF